MPADNFVFFFMYPRGEKPADNFVFFFRPALHDHLVCAFQTFPCLLSVASALFISMLEVSSLVNSRSLPLFSFTNFDMK